MPVLAAAALAEHRVRAIRQLHTDTGIERAEIDVSGGVDSAVMLGLLARALGPDRVTAAWLGIHSSGDSRSRAREVASVFGVSLIEVDLTPLFEPLVRDLVAALVAAGHDPDTLDARVRADRTVLGSIRSTLRAPVGRGLNRLAGGGLRHGTGNEDEDRWLRFYQKGGDGEVDTNPLAMLSKGEVLQLGRELGVPRSILTALPTPDLWASGEAHSDEAELAAWLGAPLTYSRVDPDTGAYARVGTIERISRILDLPGPGGRPVGEALFSSLSAQPLAAEYAVSRLVDAGHPRDEAHALVTAAVRAERATRHKHNPATPTLGTRAELVAAGLLTDALE